MTREEEIKKQAEKKAFEPSRLMHPYAKQYKVMSAYEIGYIEGAVWADEHPHWISVEDKFPPMRDEDGMSDKVLTHSKGGGIYINRYDYGHNTWGNPIAFNVTHWMPLPEAPIVAKNATVKEKGGELIPRNELCKHYRSWVGTSKGEINCACVDEETRTITKCDYTESKGCWKCPKTTKKGGEE